MLISLDLDSPTVPLYHATTQASVLFLLALLELAPPHLRRYIDPPQPLAPMFESEGSQLDLESLLFLCKDVLSTLCPALLDTDGWDQLVEKVLLLRDDYDDCDSDIPIYQSDWEKQWKYSDKQWEYSDEEDEVSLKDVSHFALEGRGRQGFSNSRHWESYGLQDGDVIRDEFDDVEKDGEGDPDADKGWHDALDSIGCTELVSRACEMLAEWVEEHGEPVSCALRLRANSSARSLRLLQTRCTAARHRSTWRHYTATGYTGCGVCLSAARRSTLPSHPGPRSTSSQTSISPTCLPILRPRS